MTEAKRVAKTARAKVTAAVKHAVAVVRFGLSSAQTAFWNATERYVDFEGAVRAGKTTPAVLKVIHSCLEHPGIQWLICRWT